MARIDHVDLVVSSVERSLPFYRELLRALGWRWVHEVEGERGETIHYLFRLDGRGSIGVRAQQSEGAQPHDRYAVGIHHLAIDAGSRRAVDRAARWAREHDVEIESGPQEYAYQPGYAPCSFTTRRRQDRDHDPAQAPYRAVGAAPINDTVPARESRPTAVIRHRG